MISNIRHLAVGLIAGCLALLACLPLGTTLAVAGTQCEDLKTHVAKGKNYHGAKCYSAKGCDCTVTKCDTDVTLYGTNHKSKVTKYKNAKCENYVTLPNQPNAFPGCKPIDTVSVDRGKSFQTIKCNGPNGCFCNGYKCDDGSYKKVTCYNAPT